MTYAIVIWVLCGIASAIVAANKGRSAFGWFLLGFLLGPIGFILSLIMGKNVAVIEENAIRGGEYKKCPFCAEVVKVEATICKHCGKELTDLEVEPQQISQSQSLHDAVWNGSWSLASRLISEGADVNEVNSDGKTPLSLARERGDGPIIKLLLANGASGKEA